jgi:hypothetical protein
MNIRKPTDYTAMFTTLDTLMAAQLPQMELYCEIGRLVSGRAEKGAAVAASEYLQATYPTAEGFSPRNLRRMRDFYRMYGNMPELLAEAMRLSWTQNVVIMEAGLTMDERCWYIRKAAESGLSKTELLRMIERSEHSEIALGENEDTCYTVENDEFSEKNWYEEYPVYLPRQHLPQPHGRVRDEGLDEESGAGVTVPYRIGGYQPGGDRQPGLSSGAAQAGGAWDLLRRPRGAPAHKPDYDKYDLLIGMDSANLRNMYRICGGDFAGKLHLLMDYTDHSGDVADPWYTEDFESTWRDVLEGCQGLLRELLQE